MPVDLQNFDMSLRCLNPSKQISKLNNGKNSTVYFSGTLKPAEYFLNLFKDNSGENNYDINNLHFDSPFPAENLWVGAITDLSVKYNDRSTSMPAIVDMIIAATSCKEGNYIVFSPSFDYMQSLHSQFQEKAENLYGSNMKSTTNTHNNNNNISSDSRDSRIKRYSCADNSNVNSDSNINGNVKNNGNSNIVGKNIGDSNGNRNKNDNGNINCNSCKTYETILQSRKMSEKDRKEFLGRFAQNTGRTLVGFAVLGGIFGEGIDLVGESLSGVVIVGVGLPQRNIVQEIIKDYYSSVFGNGYDYAYRFPGFNKILQAAGRVIRSDTDRGFILLIDDRYKIPEYQTLFPREWNVVYPESKKALKNDLSEFFGGYCARRF
jgi:Rad3-related DNA helicase